MKEIRQRTRVVGAFPDGQSCLNLAQLKLKRVDGRTSRLCGAIAYDYRPGNPLPKCTLMAPVMP
jgi:hypothetical protein